MTDQQNLADQFRALHRAGSPLLLVNAWDAASAAIIAAAGAPAIASTSAGVAWSLGAPDGDRLSRAAATALVERMVGTVSVPVTADIEAGFGATPQQVAGTVSAIIGAGAVGVNIEDAWHGGDRPLREVGDQSARLAAARRAADAAGVALYLNARIDTYLRGTGDLAETIDRAAAYIAAGADGIFVPGVVDPEVIAALVTSILAPVNILAGPGSPTVGELADLGVARVSLGSSVAQAAYALVHRAAEEAMTKGTYTAVEEAFDFGRLNALMRG